MDDDYQTRGHLDAMKELVDLSAERTYMNAERTLSVWVRTALGAMIFGIAIDRFGLMLSEMSADPNVPINYHSHLTHITGIVLVVYSMIMALLFGLRFIAYSKKYQEKYKMPAYHNVWLSSFFAFLVVLFGIPLLVIMFYL